AAAMESFPVIGDPCQFSVQLHDKPVNARVGHQEVRSRADDSYVETLLIGPLQQALQTAKRAGRGEILGRPTSADRREPREPVVALDSVRRGGGRAHGTSTRARASRSTS